MITLLIADLALAPGWAVGTITDTDPAIDRDLLLDGHGNAWIPGSTLAGSLKAHLAGHDQTHGTDWHTRLMGTPPEPDTGETQASDLWVLDAVFTPDNPDLPVTEIVGQTAIDRHRGAATATSLRYSRNVAVSGTVQAFMRIDRQLPDGALDLIGSWTPTIGRSRTSGGGIARLTRLRHGQISPDTSDGMLTWLTHTGPALFTAVATTDHTPAPAAQRVIHRWEFEVRDALLIGDPRPTGSASPRHRPDGYLIPASAWKGLFRSRTEYILRSRYGPDAVCTPRRICGTCLTCAIFGHPGQPSRPGHDGQPAARGRLTFHDSVIGHADDPPAVRHHVAIDRVTGGAADTGLYTTQPLTRGTVTLTISHDPGLPQWLPNVLNHIVRDLNDGLVGIGSRTTRGMGSLILTQPPPATHPVTIPELATRATS